MASVSSRPHQNPQPGKADRSKGRSDGPHVSARGLHWGSGTTEKGTCLVGKKVLIEVAAFWHRGASVPHKTEGLPIFSLLT